MKILKAFLFRLTGGKSGYTKNSKGLIRKDTFFCIKGQVENGDMIFFGKPGE